MTKIRKEIGVANIEYREDGFTKSASFIPAVHIVSLDTLKADLMGAKSDTPHEAVTHAQKVVASWFTFIEDVELSDRDNATIESEVMSCEEWATGKPKRCQVKFYFVTNRKED